MAFDLLDTNPFATKTFGQLDTDRPGFTFDPSWTPTDLSIDFDALELNLKQPTFDPSVAFAASLPSMSAGRGASGGANPLDAFGNVLMGIKSEGDKAFKAGWALKGVAAAGELFTKLATYSMERANADRAYRNKKADVSNQMLAIDNQVQYYKNQIADKFATTMARSSMLMAAKNLRVTAGNLLEQTKDAAYDATNDIKMLESNAELKKIALRSEARQAEVSRTLTKKLMTTDLLGSAAKLGLVFTGGAEAGMKWGDLFGSGGGSLNEVVYGGK